MTQGTRGVWRFQLGPWPVTVHWSFWLIIVMLGIGFREMWLLPFWALAGFLGILLHELGHAIAFRRYGSESRILLYAFGGLTFGDRTPRDRSWVVSLAGPAITLAAGVPVWLYLNSLSPITRASSPVYQVLNLWVFVTVFYAFFNLLPILPLDGGSATLGILERIRGKNLMRPMRFFSAGLAGVIAIWAIARGDRFLFGFLLILAVSNLAGAMGSQFENEDTWKSIAENDLSPSGRQAGVDRFAGRDSASGNVVNLAEARKKKAKLTPGDDIAEALAALERHDANRAFDAIAKARTMKLKGEQSVMLDELEGWAYLADRKPVLAADVVAKLPKKSPALAFLGAGIALVGGDRSQGISGLADAIVDGVEGHSKTLAIELVASEGITADVAKAMLEHGGKGFESALRFQVALKKLGRSAHAAMVDDVILSGGA